MKFKLVDPSRKFTVGSKIKRVIYDCARIQLEPDEQVTFTTHSGSEYDIVRKDFGFYATPSLNSRLKHFGLQAALVKNQSDNFYILLVEKGKGEFFKKYLAEEKMAIVLWLNETKKLLDITKKFKI